MEDMTASLLNNLQVFFKQNVRCAAYFFVIRIKLHAVAPASATCVFYKSKLITNLVQCVENTILKYFKIKDSNGPSISFMFYAHTAKMAVSGEES